MADAGTTKADEASRLEAALERIARFRPGRTMAPGDLRATFSSDPDTLKRRLDGLIADLRAVLGRDSGD